MMESNTAIRVTKIREDKYEIAIATGVSYKIFDIIISENGLRIVGEDSIAVLPVSINIVQIDYQQ